MEQIQAYLSTPDENVRKRLEVCLLNLAQSMKLLDGAQYKQSYKNAIGMLHLYEASNKEWYSKVMRIIEAVRLDFLGCDNVKMSTELFVLVGEIPQTSIVNKITNIIAKNISNDSESQPYSTLSDN